MEQNFKTKFESTMQASDWLSKQLVDLQMKVETSQEKLVRYQKEHEILGTDEKSNIITEKLDELNKEMTTAELDRMQKEAVYRQTQSSDPEVVAAAIIADAVGGGNGSSLLDKLREQQANLRIQVAELSTQLGPAYPKVAQLNNQLKEIDRQVQGEVNKAVDHLEVNIRPHSSVKPCCAEPSTGKNRKPTSSTRAPSNTACSSATWNPTAPSTKACSRN